MKLEPILKNVKSFSSEWEVSSFCKFSFTINLSTNVEFVFERWFFGLPRDVDS